jgi:hypothetical protein
LHCLFFSKASANNRIKMKRKEFLIKAGILASAVFIPFGRLGAKENNSDAYMFVL